MDRLKKQKKLFDIRGAELFRYSLRLIDELEEENRRNHEIRLTAERVEAITAGNDVFNSKSLDRLLSNILGSIDGIIRAAYHNTLGL